jgi:general secretion pathway protein G
MIRNGSAGISRLRKVDVGIVVDVGNRHARKRLQRPNAGVTLLELMFAVAMIGILIAVALPSYARYIARANTSAAIADIAKIHLAVETYIMGHDEPPPDLAAIGKGGMLDPWGQPYVFLSFSGLTGKGAMRKDKNLVPINTAYDLYSVGPDGDSVPPLTAKPSRDDIVMANDGGFIGVAADY